MAFLEVRGVEHTYVLKKQRIEALKGIDMSVEEKSFVTILGPSGCGKSTLLRLIAGLEMPTKGEIYLEGRRVEGPGSDRGMVFQSYTLFPWLTVKENIEFGLVLKGMSRAEREEISSHFISITGLSGFEDYYPKNLSGGMQQRVAIARALANDPEVLLMDEPFGALDAQTRMLMQEFLLRLWQDSHKTILFVTHDIEEAIFLGDFIFVMTSRPGRFKKIVEIDIPRPRDFDIKVSPEFTEMKKELYDMIREETLGADR